jgi:phenylacetate-CoA ligase
MAKPVRRSKKKKSITNRVLHLLPYYFVFLKKYLFLKQSQWWSKERLDQYQWQQLKKVLTHAYEKVPYYRKMFDNLEINPHDFKTFEDLQKLPLTSKDVVRNHFNEMIAKNFSSNQLEYVTTGGSTGNPLELYYEKGVSRAKEWAFIKTLWDMVDYHFWDKCVLLRGNIVRTSRSSKLFEYSFFGRWLILSGYHMDEKNIELYEEKIRKFKPRFIQAYPSTITLLARYMEEHGVTPFLSVKAVLLSSENLYPWQRTFLEDVLHTRVYSFYGLAEQCALAGECESNTEYHIFPEYGYVELLGKDGKPITKEGELGEIVATGFNNYAMPFIRYRTRDIALYTNKKCSCGRNYSLLLDVQGRMQDFFVSKKGILIPLTGGTEGLVLDVSRYVDKSQFYQEKKGEVILKIVKRKGYSQNDTQNILKALENRYGSDLFFKVEFVEDIPRTKAGKFLYLIQKIPINMGEYHFDNQKK